MARTAGPAPLSTRGSWLIAAAMFVLLTVAITWPSAQVAGSQVLGDLGDPLLPLWAMPWVSRHVIAVVQGDVAAFGRMWDGNIFFPEQNTLAYSDHFTAQALLGLPLWWATGNTLLVYNLSLLATFVLTGLAAFGLTRAWTGGLAAPLAAGVVAAFNPFRLGPEWMHLQVLSIQWFLFALLAADRYARHGSWWALAGLAVSTLALNLSSGYYMLYCGPFIAGFAVIALWTHGHLGDRGRWGGLITAGVVTALLTLPFVVPYVQIQRQFGFARSISEVLVYSATVEQYRTFVLPWAHIPITLAIVGVAAIAARRAVAPRAVIVTLLLFTVMAFWLSLGPVVQPWGVRGPYWWLYTYVPGFTGARVANRYGVIVLVLVPVLAGIGAAWIARVRLGGSAVVLATAVFLWQVWPASVAINTPLPSGDLNPPPAYLTPTATPPAIYREVQSLSSDAVLLELPFGDPWYDVRYMFFAGAHGRRIANGYSSFFPASYLARQRVLARPLLDPERAAAALSGVSHVIVHRSAWPDETGTAIARWLESRGAVQITSSGDALLYQVATTERLATVR